MSKICLGHLGHNMGHNMGHSMGQSQNAWDIKMYNTADNTLVKTKNPLSLLITDFGLCCRLISRSNDGQGTPLFCKWLSFQKIC